MHPPPPCSSLGPQCRSIPVTLRVATLETPTDSADHEATWLLGHTEKIAFANLRREGKDLLVEAQLHARCRFLKAEPPGASAHGMSVISRCTAHGFVGTASHGPVRAAQPRRLGGDRFLIVHAHAVVALKLAPPRRSLPVLDNDPDAWNPCSIAPCTTADHKRGSACCRDLQVEIQCPRTDTALEALVRSRLSPYLCKISRVSDGWLEAEMISACGFLDDAGQNCTLHGRERPDGRPAKPDLCSLWPDDGKGMHPGCIYHVAPSRTSARKATVA